LFAPTFYDAPQAVKGEFDIVFTSWGTICWLPDIVRWAETIASLLAPGASSISLMAHPAMLVRHHWGLIPTAQ
jgi:hypothetical protein